MKKLFTVSVLLSLFIGANAQQILMRGISISNTTPVQRGTSLNFEMMINATRIELSSTEEVTITPVLKSVEKSVSLPPVVITGSNRYKSDRRQEALSGKNMRATPPHSQVKLADARVSNIRYDYSMPYEPWMEAARVDLTQEIQGCANCKVNEMKYIIADSIIAEFKPVAKPSDELFVTYLTPPTETVKSRNLHGTAYLDFKVGQSDILTDYRRNLHELGKIQDAFNRIRNNKNAVITSIVLRGYASPEGNYSKNEKLSEQRSQALKSYLQTKYKYQGNLFSVSSVAEDWEGLKKAVENSSLDQKQNILAIINEAGISFDARETKLKKLSKGKTWKTLLDDYFPSLRRVEYKLDYTIRAFSVDEGKTIVKTNPEEMSLNEMFLVANTYKKGSPEFNHVFDAAVKMYPGDPVANINAAAAALDEKEVIVARKYLEKFIDDPKASNNTGVMYYYMKDYARAREYFQKAQQSGSPDAAKNLEIMNQKDVYDRMLQHRREVVSKRNRIQ